ncbi:MAG TPA: ArsR family transcriptional regulator [Chloroflexia bacterium]|nr:ArsR family transcriptional regulator [Chloroflexia bacterium]
MSARWDQRFFQTTRGQIVSLLRRASRTVEELAQGLELTDNAVRLHLATLERDGLVEQLGARKGAGKPAYVYSLTSQAEEAFPKAYDVVLHLLLVVLSERLENVELAEILRTTGQRLASTQVAPAGDKRTRLELAVKLLNQMGGLAELMEDTEGDFTIQSAGCPLSRAVTAYPQTCQLVEALLSAYTGLAIKEVCDRNGSPHCCFQIGEQVNTSQK